MSQAEAIEALRKIQSNKPTFYSDDTLELLRYLVYECNSDNITLQSLDRWLTMGAMNTYGNPSEKGKSHPAAIHYKSTYVLYAYLAENDRKALEHLTKSIIDGFRGMPWVEHAGYYDVFFNMNPKKVLPETKECIDRILKSDVGRSAKAKWFVEFKRNLPR